VNSTAAAPARTGRARSTSADQLGEIGLALIIERGFDSVTVDDIAAAAGIGRRTFFRYFPSKNDLPWGDFDALLDRMRSHLAEVPDDMPLAEALREAIIEFNSFPDDALSQHRQRMAVLLETPTLVAHSALRYADWRRVIADFTAARMGFGADSVGADTIARTCLAVSLAAYQCWLADPATSLIDLINEGFDDLDAVFGGSPS